ncbi:MAG: hypothetical protein AB1349_10660 [Elusimicrobiota bacterium]
MKNDTGLEFDRGMRQRQDNSVFNKGKREGVIEMLWNAKGYWVVSTVECDGVYETAVFGGDSVVEQYRTSSLERAVRTHERLANIYCGDWDKMTDGLTGSQIAKAIMGAI